MVGRMLVNPSFWAERANSAHHRHVGSQGWWRNVFYTPFHFFYLYFPPFFIGGEGGESRKGSHAYSQVVLALLVWKDVEMKWEKRYVVRMCGMRKCPVDPLWTGTCGLG